MKQKISGFTLVEVIVVVTILITLSSIAFVSYSSNVVDSRNAARISEIGNLKISLSNHKLKNGLYPLPGNSFSISYGTGNVVVLQGIMNDDVNSKEIITKPKDTFVKNRFFTYSVTNNKSSFQLATIIENDEVSGNDLGLSAYVDGDYQTKSITILPSIVFATGSSFDIKTNSGKFIVHNSTLNLPYDFDGNPYSSGPTFSQIVSQAGIEIPKFYGYYSCGEIYENGAYFGTGQYQITDENSLTGAVLCANCQGNLQTSTGAFTNNICN